MKNRRFVRHLKCFFLDHLWVILLFLAAPTFIVTVYLTVINENPGGAWWYYVLLSLFVLFCFLLYRLYSTWDFYEILCDEDKAMEDFLIREPKGREEQHYRELVEQQHRIYLSRITRLEEQQKQSKVMIYRWVHQLKTPLSVIRLISENKKGDSDFSKIAHSASQIQYDLDQVLNMYKLDEIKYAISYNAWTENADVSSNLAVIEKELQNLPGYQEAAFDLWYSESEESRKAIISASEYNKMMEFLDREPVEVSKDGVFLVTGNAGETITTIPSEIQTFFAENGLTLSVEGNTDSIITLSGFTSSICVLNDAVFEALQPQMKNITITAFLYDNWETNSYSPETIKNKLKSTIESRDANVIDAYSYYHSTQLQNNLTLYIGSMLCFTFILAVASFIYSRLYSELEAECKKYKGIVKIGLSKKELSTALNKVTSLILWIPFLVAVAYLWVGIAISERYVIVSNVPVAFRCTIVLFAVQTVVYFIINGSYKKAVFRKVYQSNERI